MSVPLDHPLDEELDELVEAVSARPGETLEADELELEHDEPAEQLAPRERVGRLSDERSRSTGACRACGKPGSRLFCNSSCRARYANRHRSRPRAVTIAPYRMSKRELARGRALYPETGYWRPNTRAECEDAARPCPFVACRFHLFVDVSPRTGSIKFNFPELEPWELAESCALDVADRAGATLEEVAQILNLTRERVRQIEVVAIERLIRSARDLREHAA